MNTLQIYEHLKDLSQNDAAKAAIYLNPPCDEECLKNFKSRLPELGEDEADWYEKLLQVSNGLQIENAVFDSAAEFIENNLERRAEDDAPKRFLIFGADGNVDSFVFDKERATKPFIVANFYGDFLSDGEISESYDTLEELLTALLNREIGE